MAIPTWQNIQGGPTFRDVALIRSMGDANIKAGIGNINDVLTQYTNTQEANRKQEISNTTNAALNSIAGFKTPEEYDAAVKAGFIDNLLSKGAGIDQAAIRNAANAHMGTLQNRMMADSAYKGELANQKDIPTLAAIERLKVAGRVTEANALVETLDPRNQGKAVKSIADQAYLDQQRSREDINFGQRLKENAHKEEMWPLEIKARNGAISLNDAHIREIDNKPGVAAAKAFKERSEANFKHMNETSPFGTGTGNSEVPSVRVANIYKDSLKYMGSDFAEDAQKLAQIFAKSPTYAVTDVNNKKVDIPYTPAIISQAMAMTPAKKDGIFSIGSTKKYGTEYREEVLANANKIIEEGAKDPNNPNSIVNQYALFNQLSANMQSGYSPTSVGGIGIPKPTTEVLQSTPVNSPTTAIDKAGSAVGNTVPVQPSPIRQGSNPSELAKLTAAAADVVTLPGRGIADLVARASNNTQDVLSSAGIPVPKERINPSLSAYGATPAYDSLMAGDVPNTSTLSIGKPNPPPVYDPNKPTDLVKSGKEKMIQQLYPTPKGYNDRVASIAALDKVAPPTTSAPIAGYPNVAKVPVKQSETLDIAPDGSTTKTEPLDVPKSLIKTLDKTNTVVEAKKDAIPKGEGTSVKVTVIDADTFDFAPTDPNQPVPNAKGIRCRWDTIDGQEIPNSKYGKQGQPFGEAAASAVKDIMNSGAVTIKVTGQDSRSDGGPARNICQVSIDGKPADIAVLKAGWAHVYEQYIKPSHPRYKELKLAEQAAMTKQAGMWKDGNYAEPGWEHRSKQ